MYIKEKINIAGNRKRIYIITILIILIMGILNVVQGASCPSCQGSNITVLSKTSTTHTLHCNTYCATIWTEDHTWNSGTVTKVATCTSTGTRTQTCTVSGCGQTKTSTIAKKSYSYTNACSICNTANVVCSSCGETTTHTCVKNYQVGSTYYATLETAIAGASAGNTIKVLKAVTDSSTATVNKNLTLDTNGQTITKNSVTITVNSGCTLNITGTGLITGGSQSHTITNNGTLNITSATIRNWNNGTSYYAVLNTGTVTLNSGTISAKYMPVRNTGTLNVKGGAITGTVDDAGTFDEIYVYGVYNVNGTVNQSGGTIKAVNYGETSYGARGIAGYGGTINVTGGTISAIAPYHATGIERYASSAGITGTVNISGSPTITATGTSGQAYGIIVNGSTDITQDVDIKVSGGTITVNSGSTANAIRTIRNTGDVEITGGTIKSNKNVINIDSSSTGTLTIGSSSAALSKTSPSITGEYHYAIVADEFNFYNGILKGEYTTPYSGTPTIRTGYYYIKKEGPSSSLYSAYLELDESAPVIDGITASSTTYTGSNITLTGKATDSASGIVAYAFVKGSATPSYTSITATTAQITQTYTVKDAGTYYFYVKDQVGNISSKSVTIAKATNTLAVTAKSLTYTGSAQSLVTASNAQGDVYYAVGTSLTSSNYTTSGSKNIPTKTNADTYTVYYYTAGNTNYNAKSGSVEVTIKAATVTAVAQTQHMWMLEHTQCTIK